MRSTFWTDERIALLRERWEDGVPARRIAADLAHGCTRMMVIGKANRMGLPMHEAALTPLKRRQQIEFIEDMFKPRVPTCQYPIGHPGEEGFHFCGDKPRLDSSYCQSHHAICYQAGSSWLERQGGKKQSNFSIVRSRFTS